MIKIYQLLPTLIYTVADPGCFDDGGQCSIAECHPAQSAVRRAALEFRLGGLKECRKLPQRGPRGGALAAVDFREVKANILHENLTDLPRFSKENVVQIADVSLQT